MALTVERMSRLTSYVLADSTLDQYLEDAKLTGADVDEAKEYWADMEDAKSKLKPGESLNVPSDWS
jgi:hypothetical protein